jgi:hypothetical protein
LEKRHFAVWRDIGRFGSTFSGGPRLAAGWSTATLCTGSADYRGARLTYRNNDDQRRATPSPAAEIRRRYRSQCRTVEAILAGACRSAKGRAECPADHD